MFKLITDNFWAKILCLLLAFTVWVYVAQGAAKIAGFPGGLSLTLRNAPGGLVAITDNDRVQVKISADRAVWKKLSSESFSAYVDLSGLTQGTHELPVKVTSNVTGVQIVEIDPEKVLVRIEPLAAKKIDVKVKMTGQAGEGLVAGEPKIEPDQVELSGAQSTIDKILEATAILTLSGETSELSKTVPLVALDSEGETVKNIIFNPAEVKVTLPIVKAGTSKTVGIKTKISGRLKSGYWLSSIQTTPEVVTVSGSSGILRSVAYIETVDINIDGLDKDKVTQVDLNLPSGVSLAEQIDKIKVELHLSPISSQKEITASFNWLGLASSLGVSSVTPEIIKVVATGSLQALDSLSTNNVVINLNLSAYKTAGTYNIDIVRDYISVPDGIAVSSFTPSSINITLANK